MWECRTFYNYRAWNSFFCFSLFFVSADIYVYCVYWRQKHKTKTIKRILTDQLRTTTKHFYADGRGLSDDWLHPKSQKPRDTKMHWLGWKWLMRLFTAIRSLNHSDKNSWEKINIPWIFIKLRIKSCMKVCLEFPKSHVGDSDKVERKQETSWSMPSTCCVARCW